MKVKYIQFLFLRALYFFLQRAVPNFRVNKLVTVSNKSFVNNELVTLKVALNRATLTSFKIKRLC